MKFEDALKAMRNGKEIRLVDGSSGTFFLNVHSYKNQNRKHPNVLRMYYKSADGKVCRVMHVQVALITMGNWEVFDDD